MSGGQSPGQVPSGKRPAKVAVTVRKGQGPGACPPDVSVSDRRLGGAEHAHDPVAVAGPARVGSEPRGVAQGDRRHEQLPCDRERWGPDEDRCRPAGHGRADQQRGQDKHRHERAGRIDRNRLPAPQRLPLDLEVAEPAPPATLSSRTLTSSRPRDADRSGCHPTRTVTRPRLKARAGSACPSSWTRVSGTGKTHVTRPNAMTAYPTQPNAASRGSRRSGSPSRGRRPRPRGCTAAPGSSPSPRAVGSPGCRARSREATDHRAA